MLAYSHTYEICINLIKNANEVSTILIGIGYRDKFNDFLFGFFFVVVQYMQLYVQLCSVLSFILDVSLNCFKKSFFL